MDFAKESVFSAAASAAAVALVAGRVARGEVSLSVDICRGRRVRSVTVACST